jgi:hypothetical protein
MGILDTRNARIQNDRRSANTGVLRYALARFTQEDGHQNQGYFSE